MWGYTNQCAIWGIVGEMNMIVQNSFARIVPVLILASVVLSVNGQAVTVAPNMTSNTAFPIEEFSIT